VIFVLPAQRPLWREMSAINATKALERHQTDRRSSPLET